MEVKNLFLRFFDCSSLFLIYYTCLKEPKVDSVKVTVRGNIRNKPALSGRSTLRRLMAQIILAQRQNEQQTVQQNGSVSTQSSLSFIIIIVNVVWRQVVFTKEPYWVHWTRHTCMQINAVQDIVCASKQVLKSAATIGSALNGAKTNEFPRSTLRAAAIIEPSYQTGQ